jgi:hypothetical protein
MSSRIPPLRMVGPSQADHGALDVGGGFLSWDISR